MDQEVDQRLCKICDWLLNSSRDHFSLHQREKMLQWSWVQGPQNMCFKAYIIHWHGPTGFEVGEAKEVL